MTLLLTDRQTEALDKFKQLRVGAAFMEQGTGKTRVGVELANRLGELINQVIWVAPFSTLGNLDEEIAKWGCNVPVRTVGYETISASDRTYLDLHGTVDARSLVIADESSFIKNADAKRTHRLYELGARAGFRFVLTGTPVTKDLWDLKRQIDWLSPRIINQSDDEFRSNYFKRISYRKAGQDKQEFFKLYEPNVAHLLSLIEPYVYRADLDLDLEVHHLNSMHFVSTETLERYRRERRWLLDNFDRVSGVQFMVTLAKLNQISSTDRQRLESVANRIDKTKPHIVFCNYLDELHAIADFTDGYPVHGDVSLEERARRIDASKQNSKPLVITYGTGSHGLNLQHTDTIHLASLSFDFARIEQAKARVRRLGQTSDMTIHTHLSDLQISQTIAANLDNKAWLATITKKQITAQDVEAMT